MEKEKIDWQYYADEIRKKKKLQTKEHRKNRSKNFKEYCDKNLAKILNSIKRKGDYCESFQHPWQPLFLRKIAIDYNIGIKRIKVGETGPINGKPEEMHPLYSIVLYNKYLCEE